MAADGTWNLTLQTPMGVRTSTLTLSTAGGTLTGQQEAEGSTQDISEASVNGNDVTWKVSITNPMPLTLTFNGTEYRETSHTSALSTCHHCPSASCRSTRVP